MLPAAGHRVVVARLALAALLVLAGAAPPASASDARRLDGGWQFGFERSGTKGLPKGGSVRWRPVTVPHTFQRVPRAQDFRGTVGWYRLRFRGPGSGTGPHRLRFEGARHRTAVWLNGRRLGGHTSGYTPFSLRARGLRPRRPNELLVRVDNRRGDRREGWWNWGGLTRPVWLERAGAVELRDLAVLSRPTCPGCPLVAEVVGRLINHDSRAQRPAVDVLLRSPWGAVTGGRHVLDGPLGAGRERRFRFAVAVQGTPHLWSPSHPSLYDAAVNVEAGRGRGPTERLRVGFRTVAVENGRLLVNGRRVSLRGASIHEDLPGRGAALSDADIERIVADLKEVGAKVTRAHYLLDERLLRRLDEEGIMVWSEAPNWQSDAALRRPAGRAAALETVRDTVLAARRHPAVLAHSVANELDPEPDRTPTTRAFLDRAAPLVRSLDPSVPVALAVAGYPGYGHQSTYDRFDVLGINGYFGWYQGPAGHEIADFSAFAPYLARMRAEYPSKGLVLTEFGAEAYRDGPADLRGSAAFQAEHLTRTANAAEASGALSGALYWTLREFAMRPGWDGGGGRSNPASNLLHQKGLLTYGGLRKPAWERARQYFTAEP